MPTKFTSSRSGFGLLLATLLLAACTKRTPASSVALASPTATTAATHTAAPMVTRTLSPTPTATRRPSRTPTSTRTRAPTLTPTSTFPPTSTYAPSLTPATPNGLASYQLKDWTADEALVAIAEADGIQSKVDINSRLPDPHYGAGDFFDYEATVVRETMSRFPEAARRADLLWKLNLDALYWSGSASLSKYFLPALEAKLNAGEIKGCNITVEYMEAVSYTANNLLGDGKPTLVCQITYLSKQATVIIGEDQAGDYKVVSLRDHWIWGWREQDEVSIVDGNNNGQPEIQVVYNWLAQGGYCESHLYLYEWQGTYPKGHFVNLGQDIRNVSEYGGGNDCEHNWGVTNTPSGTQAISSTEVSSNDYALTRTCPNYELHTTYEWNGIIYEQASQQPNTLPNKTPLVCAVGWADWAGWQNDDALKFLAAAIEQWPVELNGIWGPAAQDYFRFKLGTWYALRGEQELAGSTLTAVRDHRVNTQFSTASHLARAFLMHYKAGHIFVACRIASQMLGNSDVGRDEWWPHPETFRGAWGFSAPYWEFSAYNVCDSIPLFSAAIQSIQPRTTTELLDWFHQQQLPVLATTQGDVNNDGIQDWVTNIQLSLNDHVTSDWWAFLQTESGLQAAYITWDFGPWHYFFATLTPSPNEPGAHILQVGEYAVTFRMVLTEGEWRAMGVEMITPPSIAAKQKPTQNERVALAEDMLFEAGDIAGAQHELQRLLAGRIVEERYYEGTLPRVRAHLLYLLGLTYELSGDEANAVQTYWQLWRDYPDNPYTFIARRKLELKP